METRKEKLYLMLGIEIVWEQERRICILILRIKVAGYDVYQEILVLGMLLGKF